MCLADRFWGDRPFVGLVSAPGTPAGVAIGLQPPHGLRAGDVVRVDADALGAIENRFGAGAR